MTFRTFIGRRRGEFTANRQWALALACLATAALAAGCSSSAAHDGTSAGSASTSAASNSAATSPASSPVSSPAAVDYVTQLNALCGDLVTKVLAVYGGPGHHTSYPISVYLAERSKLAAVYRTFDAQADAIPVRPADQAADRAFDAYRRQSDATERTLTAAANTGKQANFDAAFAKLVAAEGKPDPVMDAMHAAGIFCSGR